MAVNYSYIGGNGSAFSVNAAIFRAAVDIARCFHGKANSLCVNITCFDIHDAVCFLRRTLDTIAHGVRHIPNFHDNFGPVTMRFRPDGGRTVRSVDVACFESDFGIRVCFNDSNVVPAGSEISGIINHFVSPDSNIDGAIIVVDFESHVVRCYRTANGNIGCIGVAVIFPDAVGNRNAPGAFRCHGTGHVYCGCGIMRHLGTDASSRGAGFRIAGMNITSHIDCDISIFFGINFNCTAI